MSKPRNPENKGLPQRWRLKNGAYYYAVPDEVRHLWDGKQLFRLGKNLSEAYRVWASKVEDKDNITKIDELLDRYAREIIPFKAPQTATDNFKQIKKTRAVFGDMNILDLTPQDIYAYYDKRTAKRAAKLEIALLSHAFTMAVKWGLIKSHPFKGETRFEGTKARKRYVNDAEIIAVFGLKPARKKDATMMIQSYIKLKQLTALRASDMLRLTMSCLKDDGIHITPNKTKNSTGDQIIIEWTDDLKAATDEAILVRPCLSPYLFCTRRGKSFMNEATGKSSGFDSIWQRFMKRALKETDLKERFCEKDIRAKTGSDMEEGAATRLLNHADARITHKHYRRKPRVVKPLR